MVSKGLLVRLEARHGRQAEVEDFLCSALPAVRQEAGTIAWFALRFGRGEYGILDVFADDAGREAHLAGVVARTLMAQAEVLLSEPPRIQRLNVLADKLPTLQPAEPDTKALLLSFLPKSGHAAQVEQFLRDAQPMVQEEPGTTAWFALHFDDGHYGIFDTFPDNGARLHHLTGRVPRELAKHALSLLGSLPDPELPGVLAEKLGE